MKRLVFLGTMALFVAVLAACGGSSQVNYPVTPVEPETRSGRLAPDFPISVYQGEDVLGGQEVRFSDLVAQGKPVVLNMWAGLCPPCRVEMPDLQEVHDEYGDRILLFGLDVGPFVGLGSREEGRALLKELGVRYPNGTTFDSEVVREYRVLGMPSTYFVTPKGEIFKTWAGLLTRDKLAELVEALLAASS